MGRKRDMPDNVKEAKRWFVKMYALLMGLGLSLLPMVVLADAVAMPGTWVLGTWLGFGAIGAYLFPWSKFSDTQALLREYRRIEAKTALTSEMGDGAELAADHPMHAIASRVRDLGGDDARVSKMVDDLLAQLDRVGRDADSLREAVAAEQSLASSADDRRVQRLTAVLDQRQALIAQLSGALRDLHVEHTVRQDDDHDSLFGQVSDMLAGLSAEAEVAQVSADADADADRKRRLQAMQAQKERG
jgi:hypothetical protein